MILAMLEAGKRLLRRGLALLLRLRCQLSARPVGLAIAYHRVGGPGEDRYSRLLPAVGSELFAAQVRHLIRAYRVVPASELMEAVRSRRRGERIPVAITFDDDLLCHIEDAAPILSEEGAPATFFLTGAGMDGPRSFWWERLERAFDEGAVDSADMRALAGVEPVPGATGARAYAPVIQALALPEKHRISQALLERLGGEPPDAGLRTEHIRQLADQGFEIGFHTREHHLLTGLDDGELELAMTAGRDALERAAGEPLTTIAYPHGGADERVAVAARAAGYAWGFTTTAEPVDERTDPLLIGRLYPTYDSADRFALTLGRALARASR